MNKAQKFLCKLFGCAESKPLPAMHLVFGPEEDITTRQENKRMVIDVTLGKRRKVTAAPTNEDGSPGQLDGALAGRLAADGSTTPLVTPVAEQPLSVWVNGVGDAGPTDLEIFADARLGPERREIVVPVTLNVHDREAKNLGLTVGDEEDIPTP